MPRAAQMYTWAPHLPVCTARIKIRGGFLFPSPREAVYLMLRPAQTKTALEFGCPYTADDDPKNRRESNLSVVAARGRHVG